MLAEMLEFLLASFGALAGESCGNAGASARKNDDVLMAKKLFSAGGIVGYFF